MASHLGRDCRPRLAGRAVTAVVLASIALALTGGAAAAPAAVSSAASVPDLGSNVLVFDPSMPTSQIQAAVDNVAAQQVDSEMGSQRYTLLFKPGVYGSAAHPLIVQV